MAERLSADYARENNEPLYGTIKSATHWFLLEYNGVYTNNAWDDARIPDEVKTKLENYPDSHALLIRQPDSIHEVDRIVSLFVINATPENPAIYHLKLQGYKDILDIDLEQVLNGSVVSPGREPLYAVCTNGKRDICCAKYGIVLYNALSTIVHEQVWQVSHIGGHRFAGTMYCFPDAICYGFLGEDDAREVVESYKGKQILLDKLRGHAIYDKPVQVAEYFLRRKLDNVSLLDCRYQSHEQSNEGWTMRFKVGDKDYAVRIAPAPPVLALATTGDEKFKEIPQYRFVDYREI